MPHIPDEMIRCPKCRGEVKVRVLTETVGPVCWDDLNEEFACRYNKETPLETIEVSRVLECYGCRKRWTDDALFMRELYDSMESVTMKVSTEAIVKVFGEYKSSSWIVERDNKLPVELYKFRHNQDGEYYTLLSQGAVSHVQREIEEKCGGVVVDKHSL